MTEHDDAQPSSLPPDSVRTADVIPPNTTPTWEIELLISGVTVFALLQVPALIDAWSDRMMATQGESLFVLSAVTSVYAKAAAMTLAATFVAHLGLRAYWIALVGLRSVYPDGVRWDALEPLGRLSTEIARRAFGSPEAAIERADNRASLVFAVGVGLALVMLMLIGLVGGAALIALGATFALGLREWWVAMVAVASAASLPYIWATILDRRRGKPLGAPAERAVRATLAAYQRTGMSRFSNPLLMYFMSRVGYRRAQLLFGAAIAAVVLAGVAGSGSGNWSYGAANYLPSNREPVARALAPNHYATTRATDSRAATMPYIQSETVSDAHVRLFVPYRPRRHNAALRAECPAVAARASDDEKTEIARLDALAACLAAMHPATLDGRPLPALDFVFAADPATGARGMVAMIPIADLPRGRHELTVGRTPRPPPFDSAEPPHRILFWR